MSSVDSMVVTQTNEEGETTLHIACKNAAPVEDIKQLLVASDNTAVRVQDCRGFLPLHQACMNGQSTFEVIEVLIEAYPSGLGVRSKKGKSPFGFDYEKSPGEFFSQFINFVVQPRENGSGESSVRHSSRDRIKQRFRMLGHCKNYVPLDILKKGYLNKKNLESKELVRWLNEIPCRRGVVFVMVLEFYLHIAWIVTYVNTSYTFFEEKELSWRPIALVVFAALFLFQEINQLFRFYHTNAMLAYWLDFWNWIDIASSGLVLGSAIKFLQNDRSNSTRHLLMTTGCFQALLFLSYLKKTFFPFSKFVSGVIKIFWAVIPFLVVSFVTLFMFSFMYFIKEGGGPNKDQVVILEPEISYVTLMASFQTVLYGFTGDTTTNQSVLDIFYGITVVIVLLNVIIAVVSEEWEDAVAEANSAFWSYRLDLILEKTRGFDEDSSCLTRGLMPSSLGKGLDEFYINSETAGTTIEELREKLALASKENDTLFCVKILLKSLGLILLGFPTFGVLWPKFFRQILFTPPKPKEPNIDDVNTDSERKQLEAEVANYRREVSELSQKVSVQTALIEQLLAKMESSVS